MARIALGGVLLFIPLISFAASPAGSPVVKPYKEALQKLEREYKTACAGLPGASDTRAEMAAILMRQLDGTVDRLNGDVRAMREQAMTPPPTERSEAAKRLPVEVGRAEEALRAEVDKLQRLAFDRTYRASAGMKIDEQRVKVLEAKRTLDDLRKRGAAAVKEQVPPSEAALNDHQRKTNEALDSMGELAQASDRFNSLRSDVQFCRDRALGFPGEPASAYVDTSGFGYTAPASEASRAKAAAAANARGSAGGASDAGGGSPSGQGGSFSEGGTTYNSPVVIPVPVPVPVAK